MTEVTPRLVLDQGVPRDAAELLREIGYGCTHVGESGCRSRPAKRSRDGRCNTSAMVIMLDAFCHAILALSEAGGSSVIRIRRQGLGAAAVVALVRKVLADFGDDLVQAL